MQRRSVAKALAFLSLNHFISARAEAYPSRPVSLVVPFPAGTANDSIARLLAVELQQTFGQPFVVENKPGAQGTIGADQVRRARPDGYTLMITSSSLAAAPAPMKKVPFDVAGDLVSVSRLVSTPLVLVVKGDFPASTPQQFISQVRSQAGKTSAGYGSASSQVCIAQLRSLAKVDVVDAAYKGIPQAISDVLGGTLDFTFADLGNAIAQTKGRNLKAIAVTSAARNPLVPDWPAMAEVLPGFDIDAWIGLFAPRGLPGAYADMLHEAATRAVALPAVHSKLAALGLAPAPLGPEQGDAFMRKEIDKWARLVKQAGIQPV